MSHTPRRTALVRVLAAAAWADGRVDPEEIEHVLAVARATGLSGDELAPVRELLETPVPLDTCERLVRELLESLHTDEERIAALDEVERLFRADAVLDPAEEALLADLRGALASQSAVDGFLGRITDVFRGVFSGGGSRGSASIRPYLQNLVLTRLDELSDGRWKEHIDADRLNRACLHAAALGKVADTEDGQSAEELAIIRERLAARSGAEPPLLDWMMEAVEEVGRAEIDRQRLLSEVNRISDMDQRLDLLDDAFAVAAADGTLGPGELEELRLVSNFLWIDPRDFNGVRLRWQNRLSQSSS